MPAPLKFGTFVAALALLLWLVLFPLGASAGLTRSVIYQPSKAIKAVTLDGLPAGGEVVTVRTADGLDLKGIVYRGDGEADMILVFHGNASSANGTAQWLRPLIEAGHSVIFAEYRGYAGNPGKPSEKGTALDAAAFADLAFKIARQEHHAQRVVYVGHSLGGAVAFQAAAHAMPDTLITIGAFTDTPNLAPKLARGFIADRYDNRARLKALTSPYFILHGTTDPVIPLAHAKMLFEAAEQAGKQGGAFVFEGEGHDPDGAKVSKVINLIAAKGVKAVDEPDWPGTHVMRFGKQ